MNFSPPPTHPIPEFFSVETIDNFLPAEVHKRLHELLMPQPLPELQELNPVSFKSQQGNYIVKGDIPKRVPWFYIPNPSRIKGEDKNLFYLTHLVYDHTVISPFYYNEIIPYLNQKLNIKSLIKMKINMYTFTETIREHGMHIDAPYSHKAAILSINTCDGYTKLEDGTKIDSIENRILLFDASRPHAGSTTTNQSVRVNININYF